MVELGDTLVSFLTPHYSADDVTCLFLPEPYLTPLPPLPMRNDPPPSMPLFLPDTLASKPPSQAPLSKPTPPQKAPESSQQTPKPPAPGSLAAELAAEAAFQASAKERDAQQLEELIQNNTDPAGRARHASKDKKAADSGTGESPFCIFLPSLFSFVLALAVDISKLPKDADGLAIWPTPRGVAASIPQVPATVCRFSLYFPERY